MTEKRKPKKEDVLFKEGGITYLQGRYKDLIKMKVIRLRYVCWVSPKKIRHHRLFLDILDEANISRVIGVKECYSKKAAFNWITLHAFLLKDSRWSWPLPNDMPTIIVGIRDD